MIVSLHRRQENDSSVKKKIVEGGYELKTGNISLNVCIFVLIRDFSSTWRAQWVENATFELPDCIKHARYASSCVPQAKHPSMTAQRATASCLISPRPPIIIISFHFISIHFHQVLFLHPSFLSSSSAPFSFLPPTLLLPANASIISATCTAFARVASSSSFSASVSRPPKSQSSWRSRMKVLRSRAVLICFALTRHYLMFCNLPDCVARRWETRRTKEALCSRTTSSFCALVE